MNAPAYNFSDGADVMIRVERLLAGYYKVFCDGRAFGNVRRNRQTRKWDAEIRRNSDGEIIRFAGIWNTKRDAVEEVETILRRECR